MIEKLCEAHPVDMVVGLLLVVIIILSFGKGVGPLLGSLLKKIFGKGGDTEVNVHVGETMPEKLITPLVSPVVICDPEKCPAHKAEYERSLRNEDEIKKLWQAHVDLGREIRTKLGSIDSGIADVRVDIAKLHPLPGGKRT